MCTHLRTHIHTHTLLLCFSSSCPCCSSTNTHTHTKNVHTHAHTYTHIVLLCFSSSCPCCSSTNTHTHTQNVHIHAHTYAHTPCCSASPLAALAVPLPALQPPPLNQQQAGRPPLPEEQLERGRCCKARAAPPRPHLYSVDGVVLREHVA